MSNQETMRGSVEIISNGVSTGMVVNVRDVDAIPIVVEAGQSLSDITPVDPPRDGVDAEWTATTASGFPAEVLFRKDRDYTLAEILAASQTEG